MTCRPKADLTEGSCAIDSRMRPVIAFQHIEVDTGHTGCCQTKCHRACPAHDAGRQASVAFAREVCHQATPSMLINGAFQAKLHCNAFGRVAAKQLCLTFSVRHLIGTI